MNLRAPAIAVLLLVISGCASKEIEGPAEGRQDGATLLYEPSGSGSAQNANYYPEGASLLFTIFDRGYNEGPAGLYRLTLATGNVKALLLEADADSVNLPGSIWNPTGDRFVFASDREDAEEIWTIGADGSNPVRITRHTGAPYREPSLSPDGAWIVFEILGADDRGSLWKVKADGTGLVRLTSAASNAPDERQPNWSPVDERILFQRRVPGTDDWDLFTMRADGTDAHAITSGASEDTDASWSPDGTKICFSSDRDDAGHPGIFIVPVAGGTPKRLTNEPGRADGAPTWSPDGEWIAFESFPNGEAGPASLWQVGAE